jgi:hypothetical protein
MKLSPEVMKGVTKKGIDWGKGIEEGNRSLKGMSDDDLHKLAKSTNQKKHPLF